MSDSEQKPGTSSMAEAREALRREGEASEKLVELMEQEYRSLYMKAKAGDAAARENMGKLLLGGEPEAYMTGLFQCVGLVVPVVVHSTRYNHDTRKYEPVISNAEIDDLVWWAEGILFRREYGPPPEKLYDIGANLWGETIGPSQVLFEAPRVATGYNQRRATCEWLAWLGFEVVDRKSSLAEYDDGVVVGDIRIEVSADRLVDEADRLTKIIAAIGLKPFDYRLRGVYQPSMGALDHFASIYVGLTDGDLP